MKNIVLVVIVLCVSFSFAQEKISPKVEKIGDKTEVTYYYDNGVVKQHGFFNESGKLQGTWTSYDLQGNKLAIGNYDDGKKVGKWLFWTNETLNEVDFKDSKITSVNEWKSKSNIALRD